MRGRAVLCGVLVVSAGAHAHPRETAGRYLYQVSCSARLDRFDSETEQRTSTYDLSKRTGKLLLVPSGPGPLEVCLANQAVFDPAGSVFYTLVPSQPAPAEDGTIGYRILGFSVPGLDLVKRIEAGDHRDRPPRLELLGRTARAVDPVKQPGRMSEDLSAFGPDRRALPNQIVETSGRRALLRLTASEGIAFGVADERTKTFVRLQGALAAGVDNVHLSPGGTHVLVEEVTPPLGPNATKTGKLAVYDANTGGLVETLSDPAIVKLYFRAISPSGKTLYDIADDYRFVDLKLRFPADPVIRLPVEEFPQPTVFFADR